jgi:hypothetical protein
MASGFGAVLQNLVGGRERVLAAGLIAEERTPEGRFRPGELDELFDALKVPAPKNIHEYLRRLANDHLVLRRKAGGWSLTPRGREMVDELIGKVDIDQVEAEQLAAGSSELGGVEHPLIPPEMAPLRFRPAVDRLLGESVFERNVFCMTRFPDADSAEDEPLRNAVDAAREELSAAGLTMHLASDRQADDELFGNVVAHIWGCKYGIAFLETLNTDATEGQLNDNVLIEVGAMLVSGRRCCLLKDHNAPRLPTDFIAQIYKEIEITNSQMVRANIETWVQDDLQLAS